MLRLPLLLLFEILCARIAQLRRDLRPRHDIEARTFHVDSACEKRPPFQSTVPCVFPEPVAVHWQTIVSIMRMQRALQKHRRFIFCFFRTGTVLQLPSEKTLPTVDDLFDPSTKRAFFEFSLCLSRACLGKKMTFTYKWLQKPVFSPQTDEVGSVLWQGQSVVYNQVASEVDLA
jgi:hypothetical protein